MGYERLVRKGLLGSVVETRNIYTANLEAQSGDTPQSLWAGYLAGIESPIQSYLAGVFTATTVQRFTQSGQSWYPQQEWSIAWAGGNQNDSVPNMIAAVLIGKVIDHHGFGRKFIPGLAEANTTVNALASGAVAAFATSLAAYISVYTSTHGGTVTPGIMDKNWVFHAFTSGFVSSLLGTMRRRKPGLGI